MRTSGAAKVAVAFALECREGECRARGMVPVNDEMKCVGQDGSKDRFAPNAVFRRCFGRTPQESFEPRNLGQPRPRDRGDDRADADGGEDDALDVSIHADLLVKDDQSLILA